MQKRKAAQPRQPAAGKSAGTKPAAGKSAASNLAAKPAPTPGRATAPAAGRIAELQQLIQVMVDQDVVEVEMEQAGTRWRVRRKEPQAMTFAAPMTMAMHPAQNPALPASASGGASTGPAEPQGEVFKSPMLGTFYRATSPDAEPFVKAGDKVNADSTLCIIEAMKVMNEIKAEREFEIVDVLVKNGDPVEFGQPLFLIR